MFYMYVYDKNVHKHVIDADIYSRFGQHQKGGVSELSNFSSLRESYLVRPFVAGDCEALSCPKCVRGIA